MSSGIKKLAQVVVGAVIGFAQGGPWGAVAGAALAFYAAEQQEKLNTKSPLRDNEPSAQTVRSSKAPVRFILGRVSTGGVLVWAQEQTGALNNGEWLHLVYVLSEGSISALETIYLGEEDIGTFGEFASYELVVNPTQVNAFLKANCPDWKDSQIGRGLSYVRVSLKYSAEKFPAGIPDTRFVVRGRNDIFDPRTNAAGYSANTALHLLWFLRNRCNVPDDEIVFETFASAANVCDEAVTNADGSTSQRYRTGCVIGADEQRTGVLQKLEAASGGHLIRVGGRWMFQAGAYYGPYDFEITEDMVIGTVTGSTEPTNDSAINTVRGTFIDPDQSWTETDYPEVSVAEWIVEDGGEAAETLTYSYVTDPYQAQRLANMELRRRRAGGAISIPMNFAGYNCRPGRVVRVNLPSLNILGEFIVSDWSMGDREGCTVQVKQYEAAIFDDAVGQPYNPIGFINLPSGGLGSPSSLTWTQDSTAEVIQGVLSWMPPTGIVKEYIVVVRQGTTAIQSHNVPSTSTECAINSLPSGNYTMSVSAVGPMARSGEVTITVSINGPPIPESCVVQSSIDNIVLIPANAQNGLNGGTYEYFFSTSPTATSADAEYLGQGLSFTHTGLGFWTNYYYFIRSSNAYGKSSFLYVPAQTSNDVSAYLAALAGQIGRTELGQDIIDEIDKIPGLQDQIDDLSNPMLYEPTIAYLSGAVVYQGDRLYRAKQDVPAEPGGANAPPNATYWEDIGQILQEANALAAQVSENTLKIDQQGDELTVQASKLDGVYVQVNPALAGDTEGFAGSDDVYIGVWSEQSARLEDGIATARRVDTVQAEVNENTATVQTVSEAMVDLDGKASAMWSVKMQLTADGKYVAAGIGLGIENTAAGLQSQFLVSADRFAIVNTIAGGAISVPFAVQGGQVFMNSAFIQDGSITMLKIGQYLQSDNYVAGSQGWRLDKAGNLEFNGPAPGGGRLTMTNRAVKVYDQNNVKRVQLGDLDA